MRDAFRVNRHACVASPQQQIGDNASVPLISARTMKFLSSLARPLRAVSGGVCRLLAACWVFLFGRVQWQAPAWLAALGSGFAWLGNGMRRRPRVAGAALAGLALVAAGAWYGWQWYESRPQPHTVQYRIVAPELTRYDENGRHVQPLRVAFAEPVAPLEAVGQVLTQGVSVSPAIDGQWRWSSSRLLVFEPAGDWPVGQKYDVTMQPERLLAPGVLLSSAQGTFETQAFNGWIEALTFYQDPQDEQIKRAAATVAFTHPVDEESVRRRVAFNLGKGLQYQAGQAAEPAIRFDEQGLKAYILSAALAVPLESVQAELRLDKGIKARSGGPALDRDMHRALTVPGRYQLEFESGGIIFADNDQGEPEPVLMLHSTRPMTDDTIAAGVQAWVLPVRARDQGYWDTMDVTDAVLARSARIALTHVPSIEPLNTQHAFRFDAPPGRQIFVRVQAGLEAIGGYLARNPHLEVQTMPDYPRVLRFMSEGALLGLSGERRLGFMARGVPGAQVEIARMLPNQLHHLVDQGSGTFARPSLSESSFDRMVERERLDIMLPPGDPAKTRYSSVDLGDYLTAQGGRRGVFVVRIAATDDEDDRTFVQGYEARDTRFIVVTDLGIIAKRASDGSQDVFVQSIGTGEPVAQAQVELVGRNGLPVARQFTDAQGRAHFAQLGDLRRERAPLMIVVSAGTDMSFLPLAKRSHYLDYSRFDVGGAYESGQPDRLQGYLFTDRGLYRPGETAHLGLIVRRADWQGDLAGMPLEFRVFDPRGMMVLRQRYSLSAGGFDEMEYTSSETAAAGDYQASLHLMGPDGEETEIGSTTFRVRDFEPDRMKVGLDLTAQPVVGWVRPDQVQARVEAMHLFGAPASDRRVSAEMRLAPAFAGFERYRDYRFRAYNPRSEVSIENLPDQQTDENGQATFDLGLDRFAEGTYGLQLLTRVYEAEGGRNVAAQSRVLVSSAPWLVGVRSRDALDYVARGAQRAVDWLAVGPDLEPVAVEGLTLDLVEKRYVSVLVRQPDDTYRYVSRLKEVSLGSQPFGVPVAGKAWPLDTGKPGDFSLRLMDAEGRLLNAIDYSVAGAANMTRALDRNAELQLKLDRAQYRPGDEIEISVRAPYVGAGLITIERDRVYQAQWFRADTTSSVQRIRIPDDLEGNAYVNVQFVRAPSSDEIYASPLSVGVAPFKLSLERRTLPLALTSPEKIEPGQTLTFSLESGRPARAVVYAVDEGILSVARYRTPEPLAHFFRKRALEVETSQILDLILPEFSRLLNAAAAGGDGEGVLDAHLNPFKRKRQPPVAWWSGLIDVPAGRSQFSYTVPESFNGSLRLFAVAVDAQGIGVAEGASAVRGPLVITPNVPAAVSPGDRFEVTAGVYSNLDAPAEVRLEVVADTGLVLADGTQQTLTLAPRREQTLKLQVQAGEQLGAAALRWTAHLPDGRKVSIGEEISVRPLSTHRVTLDAGRFSTGSQTLALSRNLHDAYRQVGLSAAASPLAWISGLSQYLGDYSYSCTEQMVSKAMPALVLGTEAGGTTQQARDAYAQAERLLRQRMNYDGGIGMWSASLAADDMATLYALDFLIEARQRGLVVSDDLLARTLDYAEALANRPSEGMEDLRLRAYAAYLLTRQGRQAGRMLADIREQYEVYHGDAWRRDLGAAYLAAAYRLMREDRQADALFADVPWQLLSPWQRSGQYSDPLIHDAERLTLMSRHFAAARKSVPDAVLDRMGEAIAAQRYSSYSAALLVRALDAYGTQAGADMALQASARMAAQAGVTEGQQIALDLQGNPPQAAVPVGTRQVELEKTGRAPAFYMLSQAGFDRDVPTQPVYEGLEVMHAYLDLDGKPLTRAEVGQEMLVQVRVRVTDDNRSGQVAVVDLLPGGVEPVYRMAPQVDENSSGYDAAADESGEYFDEEGGEGGWRAPIGEPERSDWEPEQVDVREDRVILYGWLDRQDRTFVYRVRAVSAGEFGIPPAYAEGMYDPTLQARGAVGRLEIVQP